MILSFLSLTKLSPLRCATSVFFAGALVASFAACSSSTVTADVSDAGDPGDGGGVSDGSTSTSDGASTVDGGGKTSPDSSDATYDFCTAQAERATKCGDTPSEKCAQWSACYATGMRPGVAAGLERCITDRACDVSDDPCFATAAQPYANDPSVVAFTTACLDKRSACGSAGGGNFSDDYCAPTIGLFPSSVVDGLTTCLQNACNEVTKCFQEKLTAIGCGK